MQDDRALTFRQIHGNKEALLSAVEDIERIALVESYEIEPLRLRFLAPYPQGGTEFDYILTLAREIGLTFRNDDDYITVSYVWAHSQPLDGIKLPEYRVWDGTNLEKPPRLLRCPPIVFHRVVQYAESAKLERIWIDQECIDQDDSNDVEKHLQDMHRIYGSSRITAAVLSKISDSWTCLPDCFHVVMETETWSQTSSYMLTAEKTLWEMIYDPWFTRSWTFHEQHRAADIVYLLPVPPLHHDAFDSPEGFMKTSVPTLERDVSVHQTKLRSFFYLWKTLRLGHSVLESFFFGHGVLKGLRSANIPGAIETVQGEMEERENQVLPDRIQIIANVCELGWKLKTTLLNSPTQSYSTCLLALTMANTWSDSAERVRQYQAWGDAFMGGDIEDALNGLKVAQRRDLRRLAGFRPDFVEPLPVYAPVSYLPQTKSVPADR